jgi:homoserine O-acetyltransferase
MDYFDMGDAHGGRLAEAFKGTETRFCLVSFDSDWLYPTEETRHVVHALNAARAPVSFVEIESPHGHDAFLLDVPEMNRIVDGFLRAGEQ